MLGSPDPPLPFTIERIFDKLPIQSPIAIAKQPDSDWVWVVTEPLQYAPAALSRLRNDPQATELEMLIPTESTMA